MPNTSYCAVCSITKTLYSPVGNSPKIDFWFWNLQITQDLVKITQNHTQKSSLIRGMVKFSKFTFQKNKHIRVLSWSILSIIYHQTYVTNISSSSSRSLRLRHFFEMFEISRPEIDTSLRITSPSLLINRKNINISILKREESKREEHLAMILFEFRWFFDKLSFSNFRDQRLTHLFEVHRPSPYQSKEY